MPLSRALDPEPGVAARSLAPAGRPASAQLASIRLDRARWTFRRSAQATEITNRRVFRAIELQQGPMIGYAGFAMGRLDRPPVRLGFYVLIWTIAGLFFFTQDLSKAYLGD